MTIEEVRRHFPHTADQIYINHAATGPLGTHILQALDAYFAQRHGELIENYFDFMPVIDDTLEKFATIIGARADQVEFVPNTSYGISILAEGLDWKRGDRIAVPACEFPANVFPYINLRDCGVEVDFIAHNEAVFTLEDLERTLTPQTRLVSVSWVQFLSGHTCDLKEIVRLCHDRDILVAVDAIQGLGALQLDVADTGIDFLATGGHKWLMATQGVGFVYVADHLLEEIRPRAGWLHGPVDWENLFDYELKFHPDARRYRLGTLNSAGIASMNAALKLYLHAGPENCEERILSNVQRLDAGLREAGLKPYGRREDELPQSGIISYRASDPNALFEHLQSRNVISSVRNEVLRFSPTYYNTEEEMDVVVEHVRDNLSQ